MRNLTGTHSSPGLKKYNKVTRFHLELWEINRTRYPQVTGPTPWLYRIYSFHLHGGMDERFIRADDKGAPHHAGWL